jgi:arylsulfatase A-like enzyme
MRDSAWYGAGEGNKAEFSPHIAGAWSGGVVGATQKSIVLVTVDCLRADHVGFGGYQRPTTPFLDSLAAESFVFPAAIVAGSPTYYSLPAMLAARSPLALGRDVLGLAPGEPVLASVLKHSAYATAAFSAANPYISARFGYDQGFGLFRDFLEEPENGDSSQGHSLPRNGHNQPASNWVGRLNENLQKASRRSKALAGIYDELYFRYCQRAMLPAGSLDALRRFPAADAIVDLVCSWLCSLDQQPFFLWLHLMDPHAPYYPKPKALQLMGKRISADRARYVNSFWLRHDVDARRLARYRDEIIDLYDAGIRGVDAQMERLVEALRDLGLWENCVFALTADHGEEFLEHGGRYHAPAGLLEELIRVPLLLRVPGAGKKQVTQCPFSLVDLAPTLLEAAQVQVTAEFQGRSRWREIRQGVGWDEPALVECVAGCTNPFHRHSGNRMGPRVLAVREVRYKLVLEFDPPRERLYDLESDPRELTPLPTDAEKAVRGRFLQYAREHIERSRRQRGPELVLRARLAELRLEWANSAHASETAGF